MSHGNGQRPDGWEEARLRAALRELDADEAALVETVARLSRWPAPAPDEAAQAVLLDQLMAELPSPPRPRWAQARAALAQWWPWLLLRSQGRVVRGELWAASALVLALGVVVTLWSVGLPPGESLGTLPFVLLAPVMAAVGVAFLYDPANQAVMELEAATPVSAQHLLLTRLALVFGFNLLGGLVGSALLALWLPSLSLWPLVLSWLAPMTFLSALAFLLAVLALDPALSMAVSLTLWILPHLKRVTTMPWLWTIPDWTTAPTYPWLFVAALLLVAAALWASERERQWHGGDRW